MTQRVIQLRVLEQGLRRNAPPIQTGAAGSIHFHAGYFFAKLSCPNGADVSSRSAADDDEIVFHVW